MAYRFSFMSSNHAMMYFPQIIKGYKPHLRKEFPVHQYSSQFARSYCVDTLASYNGMNEESYYQQKGKESSFV